MATKGTQSKEQIFSTLLKTYTSSFMYNDNKECRINLYEDGQPIQIKVTLTYAKTPVQETGASASSSEYVALAARNETFDWGDETTPTPTLEPSEDEKENIAKLISKLGPERLKQS